ncbi:MAG: prepilin peptidase [Clostridia bacterium]|nr:prepilin peptidase [Clostridia bacterium]
MLTVIYNVIIALLGLAFVPTATALVDIFAEEEKVTIKAIKEKKKFNCVMGLILPISLIILFYAFGLSLKFAVYAFLAIMLIIDAFVDVKAQIIPNELNFIGFLVGIVLTYIALVKNTEVGLDMLLGMLTGGGIFLLIALFAFVAYKKEGMGLGDVKLMGVLGLFFGVCNTIQIFILSFAIGAVVSILLMIFKIKKSTDYMAFGPFIVIATAITMFLPYTVMLPWYMNLLS